jgi:hypothetical protein
MTIEHEPLPPVAVDEPARPCATCGAPLARDQRYCLNCGERRHGFEPGFVDVIEARARRIAAMEVGVLPTAAGAPRNPATLLAVGAFALVGGLGVLIGSIAGGDDKQVAAAPAQVITVAAPPAGAAPTAAAKLTSDWPNGKDGFTVQLQRLDKDASDVAAVDAAKAAAEAKGAADVGALDADDYSSLDGGSYVVYAGIYETRKQAAKGLRRLRKDFPRAKVIAVSAGGKGDAGALSGKKKEATVGRNDLKKLQKLSPEEYQKKSRKLPDTTKLPGKAPPKDNKKPGGNGGGGADVIG